MKRALFHLSACTLPLLAGCSHDDPPPEKPPVALAPSATVAAAAMTPSASATAVATTAALAPSASAPSPAPVIGAAPACRISAQKTWGSGANKTTGLTAVELPDGRVALGLALGLTPHVLVVGRGGDGKLYKAPAKDGTELAKQIPPAEGRRTIMRVTPVKVDAAGVSAFVDYRDEYKNKRRRVACGPADGDDAWIVFDGVPFFDRDDKPTGAARDALFHGSRKEQGGDDGYHELRDCRTFADLRRGETWIVGSEVRGVDKPGGGPDSAESPTSTEWKASLVIDKGAKDHEIHLHELDLKGQPPKITDFQVPMLRRLSEGSYVLTARYGDSMLAALLNADKSLKASFVRYPGFATRADVASDAADTIIATSVAKGKDYVLKAMRLAGRDPTLPRVLENIITDDDGVDSETEPDFTRDTKGQRWVSYIEGERGNGHLEIVPVDANFRATGKPFLITQEEDRSSEARLVELDNGSILVAFLRDKDKKLELVTEELSCDVVK